MCYRDRVSGLKLFVYVCACQRRHTYKQARLDHRLLCQNWPKVTNVYLQNGISNQLLFVILFSNLHLYHNDSRIDHLAGRPLSSKARTDYSNDPNVMGTRTTHTNIGQGRDMSDTIRDTFCMFVLADRRTGSQGIPCRDHRRA